MFGASSALRSALDETSISEVHREQERRWKPDAGGEVSCGNQSVEIITQALPENQLPRGGALKSALCMSETQPDQEIRPGLGEARLEHVREGRGRQLKGLLKLEEGLLQALSTARDTPVVNDDEMRMKSAHTIVLRHYKRIIGRQYSLSKAIAK